MINGDCGTQSISGDLSLLKWFLEMGSGIQKDQFERVLELNTNGNFWLCTNRNGFGETDKVEKSNGQDRSIQILQ